MDGIAGTLPPSIVALTSMTALSLSNNLLVGTLPTGVSVVVQLASLLLGNNGLSGSVPSDLITTSLT